MHWIEENIEYPISDSQSWGYITITWKVLRIHIFSHYPEVFTSKDWGTGLHVYFYIKKNFSVYYALFCAHMYVCNRAIM